MGVILSLSQTGVVMTRLNPRCFSAFICADTHWTCPAARQAAGRQAARHEGNTSLTCSPPRWTYLINKSHCRAPDSADATPLLFGRRLRCYRPIAVPLFLSPLFLHDPSCHAPFYFQHPSLFQAADKSFTLFIMPRWQFNLKLHIRTDWALAVIAEE